MDVKRLISEVVERNGIRIDKNDPAFCLVTLNELVLEESSKKIIENVRSAIIEFEAAVDQIYRRSGAAIAEHIKQTVSVSLALYDSSPPAKRRLRHVRITWFVYGLSSALVILGAGVLIGLSFH
jgi:hypothetical protein